MKSTVNDLNIKCVAINTRDLVSTLVDYQASYYKVITSLKVTKRVIKTDLQADVLIVKH